MKYYAYLILGLVLTLNACKEDDPVIEPDPLYTEFLGEYDIVNNGTIDGNGITNEPAYAWIRPGEKDDEIFIYVELDALSPLGVHAIGEISEDGTQYEVDEIIAFSNSGININFRVQVTGELESNGDLTSEVTFSGGINGTVTCQGVKQ